MTSYQQYRVDAVYYCVFMFFLLSGSGADYRVASRGHCYFLCAGRDVRYYDRKGEKQIYTQHKK